jgi:hypothetical protein
MKLSYFIVAKPVPGDKGTGSSRVFPLGRKKEKAVKKGLAHVLNLGENGVPETIRTSDPFLRREVLYPAELRGHNLYLYLKTPAFARFFRGCRQPIVPEGHSELEE